MKVRNGFVSNSSSSSYIVKVPRGFKISAKDLCTPTSIEEMCDSDFWDDENDAPTQEAIDAVNDILNNLANGYSHCYGDTLFFWTIVEIIQKNNMIVMTVDGDGGDGEDTIVPFYDGRKRRF